MSVESAFERLFRFLLGPKGTLSRYNDDPLVNLFDPIRAPLSTDPVVRDVLVNWDRYPIQWDGNVIRQRIKSEQPDEEVNPNLPYKVTWYSCGQEHAVYVISQPPHRVLISTMAPGAEDLLVNVLNVSNYPLEPRV